jgi:hypothetical protein
MCLFHICTYVEEWGEKINYAGSEKLFPSLNKENSHFGVNYRKITPPKEK